MEKHTLLIDCPDQKGLVHKITGILFKYELNVEDQGEFVDQSKHHFFMRTVISGELEPGKVLSDLKKELPKGACVRLNPVAKRKIVLLVTKEAHCLGDLLIRHNFDELNAEIQAVIGNHEKLGPLVEKFDIPFHFVPHHEKPRRAHESEILEIVDRYNPEFIVLAKYMRILSRTLVMERPNQIINIHHSFLPAFVGAKPYHQAFERGVKIIGATAHFVTDSLDEGPIIAQDVIPVDHTKIPKDMVHAGRNVEKIVLANALKLVFEDRIFVFGNRTIIFG